jgi:hypothetical protein
MSPASSQRLLALGLLAAAAAALVAHSLVWNFVTDDAFISFVYARNLAEHGQLVFNLGERVEGYTNFLWTVILAGLYKLGLAQEITSRVLGTAFAVGTMIVCAVASRRLRATDATAGATTDATAGATDGATDGWSAWDAVPALILAGVPGYACWSSGGLETQLFAFLITLGVTLFVREELDGRIGRGAAVAFGLAALTRPEGLLFFALVQLARAARRLIVERRLLPTREAWRALAIFALLVGPHLLWRRWYYGWWVPNTFYIKASAGKAAWAQGGYYLTRVVEQFHLWVVPLIVVAALARGAARARGLRLVLGLWLFLTTIFAIYVASVGGDFMGLFRFVMPVIPLTALVTALSLRRALGGAARPHPAVAVAVVALALAGHAWHAVRVDRASLRIGADRGIDTPGFLRWYTADRAAIGKWFGQYAQPDDYAAVGGAGAQVYYSRIRSLDCFGLSDEYIAHQVPPVSARPGHQKYAPLEYQLSRRPTIITSSYYRIAGAPYQPSPAEAEDWRRKGYRYVSAQIPGLSSPWYSFLLRTDRRLGPFAPEP